VYEFATVALLGLAVCKVVDLAGHTRGISRRTRALLAVLTGIGLTWATDYSVFSGWGIQFRSGWMGPVATGLAVAGLAAVWHELLDVMGGYARRAQDQAAEIETHIPRAA
jgi:hypothetical protein